MARHNVTITGSVTNYGKLIFTGAMNNVVTNPLNFINNGTITSSNDGLLDFRNTRAATFSGSGTTLLSNVSFTAFGNADLTLNTSNFVNVSQLATLNGSNVISQGKLRLTSDATSTGILFNAGPGIIPDEIVAQRYIDYTPPTDPSAPNQEGFGYRHFSSPVDGADFSMFQNGTSFVPVYDDPTSRYQYPTNTNPQPRSLIYYYSQDELARTTDTDPTAFEYGWLGVLNGTVMETGRGYTVQISALNTSNGSPNTISVHGVPHTGSFESPVYGRGTNDKAGYQLVGNPYPGFINMLTVTQDNVANGFDQTAFKYRSTGPYSGVYEPYEDDGTSSDETNQFFPMMQGFFVRKADASNASPYMFNDSHRVGYDGYPTSNTRPFFRTAPVASIPTFNLLLTDDSNAKLADATRVTFRSDATAGHDMRYDAVRPGNNVGDNPTLFTITAAREECSRNALPSLEGPVTVPLGLRTLVPGHSYTLSTGKNNGMEAGQVFLEDRMTGKVQNLLFGNTLKFTASNASEEHRFFLRFESNAAPAHSLAPTFETYPNPIGAGKSLQFSAHGLTAGVATATLFSTIGEQVLKTSVTVGGEGLLQGELPLTDVKPGIYILRFTSNNNVTTQRIEIR